MKCSTSKLVKNILALLFVILSFSDLLETHLYGRAGGGDGYTSESSSGSSSYSSESSYSSSSSSSSSDGSYDPITPSKLGQTIGLMFAVGGIIVMFVLHTGNDKQSASTAISPKDSLKKPLKNQKMSKKPRNLSVQEITTFGDSAIHKIKGHDVNFKPKEFLARVESAFMIVQNSWTTGNLIPMRPFSSDGVYERFSIQFEDLKAQKLKNKLSDIKIQSCKIYSHDIDGKYESTTVELSASMKDEYVNEKGKTVKSSPAEFTEYWTFTRFVGVKTKNTKGLLEGCCPECTVPMVMSQHAKCPACNVILRSGEFDWVLTEITQEVSDTDSEISFDEIENVRQKDPYFSVQLLEDHASVIFWRMMTTRRTKNLKILDSVAQTDLCQTIADLPVRTDIGVGSVELTGFERMPNQLVAKIHVKWMAKTNPKEPSERFASDMVLIRRDNAQSELQNKMGSLHCKSCGLAVGDVVDSNCSGCGTTIKDEGRQWILAGWETLKSPSINSRAA